MAGQNAGFDTTSGCFIIAGLGIANAALTSFLKSQIDVEFQDAIRKPFQEALQDRAYCDKLAWTAALLHNFRAINPIPKIPGLDFLLRSEWTTMAWWKRKEEYSVMFYLDRIRDAAVHAVTEGPSQHRIKETQLKELAADKFFDDILAKVKPGIDAVEARYLRAPRILDWVSTGTGGIGLLVGLKGLLSLF